MNKKLFGGAETKLVSYVDQTFCPEDTILKEVRDRMERKEFPMIQVGKMDGLHLEVLTRVSGAKKAVEIGTLAGYSGICILRGLGRQGKLYTFELLQSQADEAKENFRRAGFIEQVEIFVGPALEELRKIEKHAPFDLIFIDADKVSYPQYLNWASRFLRVGGVVIADNTFGWGMIAEQKIEDEEDAKAVKALREYNSLAAQGGHFRSTILPTGEGLTVSVKVK
jgi:caffeoyl-CoA O-methyltransferase